MTYSVMVISGDMALRGELICALHKAGFAVAAAPDYREMLSKQNGFKPDLVIIDDVLLHEDAMNACYQLRNAFGIPVILLGRDSSEEAWRRVMEADIDSYLVKPVRYRELIARVRAILRRFQKSSAQ